MNARWTASWQALRPREQRALKIAAALLAGLALWLVLLAPAWHKLQRAAHQKPQALSDWHAVQRMAQQAQQWRRTPPPPMERPQALLALQQATRDLLGPSTTLHPLSDQVQVTLQAVPAEALAQWLARVRLDARLHVQSAQLRQGTDQQWQGTLSLRGEGLSPP